MPRLFRLAILCKVHFSHRRALVLRHTETEGHAAAAECGAKAVVQAPTQDVPPYSGYSFPTPTLAATNKHRLTVSCHIHLPRSVPCSLNAVAPIASVCGDCPFQSNHARTNNSQSEYPGYSDSNFYGHRNERACTRTRVRMSYITYFRPRRSGMDCQLAKMRIIALPFFVYSIKFSVSTPQPGQIDYRLSTILPAARTSPTQSPSASVEARQLFGRMVE